MPVTLKCPDCGRTAESDDGEPMTCPECEGTMAAPPKKKYQAKASSLEEEERARKKSKSRDEEDERPKKKPRPADDEDEDEKPKAKKKPRDEDEEDDEPKPKKKGKSDAKSDGTTRDGAAAESLGISTGFKNKELMAQVEAELEDGEVLHWAGRMDPGLVAKTGNMLRIVGFIFAGMGLLFTLLVLALAPGLVKIGAVVPLLFVGIGVGVALFLPGLSAKAAKRGWYAVTDQRAIVYAPSLFGSGGKIDTYEPKELRKMRVKKASGGAGDLVFKTKLGTVHTNRGTRTEEINYGFLGIKDVYEVETLIRKVLLGEGDEDDDE